jgi:predicted AlkP superfamily phosphohydrolase/phosphomutase
VGTTAKTKVLLVGIDGLQYDRIQPLSTPNLKSLFLKKAYTGGIKGALSEQVTLSGPGWMSVLTGTK